MRSRRAARAFGRFAGAQPTLARNADHDPRATIEHFRSLLARAVRPAQWRLWIGAEASTPARAVVRAVAGRRRRQRACGRMAGVTLGSLQALWDPARAASIDTRTARTGAGPEPGRRSKTTPRSCTSTSKRRCGCVNVEWLEQAAAIVRWVRGRDGRCGARRLLQRRVVPRARHGRCTSTRTR